MLLRTILKNIGDNDQRIPDIEPVLSFQRAPDIGAEIEIVAEMRRALVDTLEGMRPKKIRAMTGLSIERCNEIYRLVSWLR